MCVICVKPKGILFPSAKTIENCFENNDDGAGFMYVHEGKVHIRKGYKTLKEFNAALDKAKALVGEKAAFVMHFRISTQGFDTACTHPFPLSSKMENLKKLKTSCSIGIAHNGILHLTSDGSKEYSDTMKFITDYLSLIIRNRDWYKDKRTVQLIENLIKGNRLAFLDDTEQCVMLGKGWEQSKEDGCYYSNNSYSYRKYKTSGFYTDYVWDKESKSWKWKGKSTEKKAAKSYSYYGDDYDDWLDDFNQRYVNTTSGVSKPASKIVTPEKKKIETPKITHYWYSFLRGDGSYDFTKAYCPYTEDDDDSYCSKCNNKKDCAYYAACLRA